MEVNDLVRFIKKIIFSRFGKVFMAGGVGALSQLLSYGVVFHLFVIDLNILHLSNDILLLNRIRLYPKFFVAQLLAIEVGVIVTFFINNNWAFNDKKLKGVTYLKQFAKNHFVVAGAILIQLGVGQVLASLFGVSIIKDYIYQIIGILVGLIWNFYFYKRVIWKVK